MALSPLNNFTKAVATYDDVAWVQKDAARTLVKHLLKTLPLWKPISILDAGCGTGYASACLSHYFPDAHYTLSDLCPLMLQKASEQLVQCTRKKPVALLKGDMASITHLDHDLIVSNFALQWVSDLKQTLNIFYKTSQAMVFTCLLDGTFFEWENLFLQKGYLSPLKKYPTLCEMHRIIQPLNPEIYAYNTKKITLVFKDAQEFLRYLQKLGASGTSSQIPLSHVYRVVKEQIHPFNVTYNIFFATLKKEL